MNVGQYSDVIAYQILKRKGCDDELAKWCVGEAYDDPFIENTSEFVMFCVALFRAVEWGRKIDLENEKIKKTYYEESVCKKDHPNKLEGSKHDR